MYCIYLRVTFFGQETECLSSFSSRLSPNSEQRIEDKLVGLFSRRLALGLELADQWRGAFFELNRCIDIKWSEQVNWRDSINFDGTVMLCYYSVLFLFAAQQWWADCKAFRFRNGASLPTWRTESTQPDSKSLSPRWKGKFWYSTELIDGLDSDEYMQISRSLRGNDQKMTRRWTGSGMRS